MRLAWWFGVYFIASMTACSVEEAVIIPEDSGADTSAPDSGAADSASPPDSGRPPDSATASDSATPPGDAAPDATEPSDSGMPPSCGQHVISACAASHSDVDDCAVLFDGLEVAPECPTRSRVELNCREGAPTYCDTSDSCPDIDGCIADVWFQFDLGAPQPVDRVRFLAGWWQDRPEEFEIWSSNSAADVPDAGATLVFGGSAHERDWRCVTDEACTEEVPDGCCPDGRGAPQVTDQRSYDPSCNLGDYFPKFDIANFPQAEARYWYLMVRNGRYRDRVFLNEVEFFVTTACR